MKPLLLTLIAAISLSSSGFATNAPATPSQEIQPQHPLQNMLQVQMLINQLNDLFEKLPPAARINSDQLVFATTWVNQLEAVQNLRADRDNEDRLVNLIDAYKAILEGLQTEDFTSQQKSAIIQVSWNLLLETLQKDKDNS